jgi:RHS repeat-associated protein
MLNRVSDRAGNNYVVSYNNSTGFAVPDVISWTPSGSGAGTYRYEAKFNYFTGRTDADSYFGKVAGYDVVNRNRLESIQIKSAGVVKRKYRLTYDTSSVTSRSRLTSFKECADDAETNCYLPTTFTYQMGQGGVSLGASTTPGGSSTNLIKGRYDLNGDGKDDVVYWGGSGWNALLSSNLGFAGPYATGATASSILIDEFLPIGRDAIATVVSGTLWTYRWDNDTSAFVSYNTGTSTALPTTTLDYNGDRLADLVYFTPNSATLTVRANTSTGSGNPSFASGTSPTAALGANRIYAGIYNYNATGRGLYRTDVNGDGRQDLNVQIVTTGFGGGQTYATILLGSSTGFDVPAQALWQMGAAPVWPSLNFNGDRCTDRWEGSTIKISACSGVGATSVALPAAPLMLMDWDGDGKTDILVDNGGNFGVYKSTGVGLSGLIATSIPSAGDYFSLDQDGDGLEDLIKVNGTSPFSYWTHTAGGSVPTFATNVPDLLSNVTDGFGVSNSPSYVSTAWSNYSSGATTTYPLGEIQGGKVVVSQVTSSDGSGGTFNKTYFYVGARYNAARDEVIAFQRLDETDSRNGLISRSYFEQGAPVAGMVSQREVMQPNGVTPISRVVFTNNFAVLDSTANNQRYFFFSAGSTATTYEVGGALNGSLVRTVTTADYYDNTSGSLTQHSVTTTEPASGANGVTPGGTWLESTSYPVASMLNDTANWCLGRPQLIQQTNLSNLTYGAQLTRTRNVVWDAANCRPTQTIDEPGNGTLQVTTDIGYDGFGNVNSSTVTGVGMTARTTSAVYSNGTYTTGQFPLSETNALSQTTSLTWNYDLAVPLNVTDPNGLTTSWLYDPYGRRTRETRPDSTYTTWAIAACTGCGTYLNTWIDRWEYTSGGSGFHRSMMFVDHFDRLLVEYSLRPDNQYTITQRDFDALGRVSIEYFPYINSAGTVGGATITYDLVGRPSTVSRPISDTNSTLQTTTYYYEGLTSRVVDAQSKQSSKVTNAAGELVRTIDHNGYYQAFEYDAFGNPKRVMDQLGNTLQSSTYNLRGMLTQRIDMDMGTWNFTPNALGETVSQMDAKSQTTTFAFDLLGRLTSRTEAEGTSTWTWGTSSAAKNIGQLASVSGPGYSESYTYDAFGRPSSTSISADTTYQIDYSYNNMGALDTLTYPTSTSSYRLKLQYEYQNGTLYRIKDFNAPSYVFWTASPFTARGQPTGECFGNGLCTVRAFDAVTGWLKSTQTGLGGGTGVQNLAYEWDLVGNLKKRKDVNQSNLTEEFFYDNLYRLDYSQLNGVTNLDLIYDALGNISAKSDVGTYTYHATKKHQLTSINNGWSFSYDNNGNMTSGRGGTITWTSFNYPASIANGTDTASFSYTPGRQYWKQISNYTSGGAATTIYVGGLLEKVTTSSGTDYRHRIRAGSATIIVSRQSGGTNTTNYVTTDHLGSSSVITNSAGATLVNSSFDAFGRRRGSNWSGAPSSGDWTAIASTTRRGYTDHSMLDNLNLIHMNGRVQDPLLGRFISADPFITEPGNTQNYNRYSYVYNNPLTYLDPSGFDADIICPVSPGGATAPNGIHFECPDIEVHDGSGRDGTSQPSNRTPAGSYDYYQAVDRFGADTVRGGASALPQGELTTRDVWQSVGAGIGNSIASAGNSFVNLMISIGDINGDVEPVGPWRPFEPRSEYFGRQGDAIGTGLMAIAPVKGVGRSADAGRGAGAAERQIAAAWGAGVYRHGGLMTSIEHVMYRHGFKSGFSNVSRFAEGTRIRDISNYVDSALRYGSVRPLGSGSYAVEYSVGRVIGTNIAGDAASSIRVIVQDGIIRTAFPF